MPGGNGNDMYLGKTLRYDGVELAFNESVNWRTLFYLWLRAFIVSFMVWAVFATIAGFLTFSARPTTSSPASRRSTGNPSRT